jgi:hypothetical protein
VRQIETAKHLTHNHVSQGAAQYESPSFWKISAGRISCVSNCVAQNGRRTSPATNSKSLNLSEMLWTILPYDTLDSRIVAVAEAGYRSIELVHEFDRWAPSDFDHFNRRRAALGISVDAIALTQPGVANPSASDTFLRALDGHIATAELLD